MSDTPAEPPVAVPAAPPPRRAERPERAEPPPTATVQPQPSPLPQAQAPSPPVRPPNPRPQPGSQPAAAQAGPARTEAIEPMHAADPIEGYHKREQARREAARAREGEQQLFATVDPSMGYPTPHHPPADDADTIFRMATQRAMEGMGKEQARHHTFHLSRFQQTFHQHHSHSTTRCSHQRWVRRHG